MTLRGWVNMHGGEQGVVHIGGHQVLSTLLTHYSDSLCHCRRRGHARAFWTRRGFQESGSLHQAWSLLSLKPNPRSMLDRLDLWFERTHSSGNLVSYAD